MTSMIVDITTGRQCSLTPQHPKEFVNRIARAKKLVALARQFRLYTSQVERMDEAQWSELGRAADINLPISQETKSLTIELLKLVRAKGGK